MDARGIGFKLSTDTIGPLKLIAEAKKLIIDCDLNENELAVKKQDISNALEIKRSYLEQQAQAYRALISLLARPEFILTGSHRFGTSTVTSDYDYLIHEDTWNRLLASGELKDLLPYLKITSNKYGKIYGDQSLRQLVEFSWNVDIQIIKRDYYEQKLRAHSMYAKVILVSKGMYETNEYLGRFSKILARNIWRILINNETYKE